MTQIRNLSVADVVAIAVVWAGATAVTFITQKPVDELVVVAAIASAYYSVKWIVLKGQKLLSAGDIASIFLCWSAATAINYFVQDGVVGVICMAAAYYLSKWIIRKEAEGPTQ